MQNRWKVLFSSLLAASSWQPLLACTTLTNSVLKVLNSTLLSVRQAPLYVLLLQVCLGEHPPNCMLEAFRQASAMYLFSRSVLESTLRIACWRPSGRPPLCTSSLGWSWRASSELHAGGLQAGLRYVLLLQVCLGKHPLNCMLEAFRQASTICTSSPSLSWRASSELHAGGLQAGLRYAPLL